MIRVLLLLALSGCLVNQDLYDERLDDLSDTDDTDLASEDDS